MLPLPDSWGGEAAAAARISVTAAERQVIHGVGVDDFSRGNFPRGTIASVATEVWQRDQGCRLGRAVVGKGQDISLCLHGIGILPISEGF
mmetsp:Transcript_22270/g.51004  ORF Transcript_22270/g.51004 Transcript_22270/m.51004 type:complete len:90 (-) Transcript_22270:96-365(-)